MRNSGKFVVDMRQIRNSKTPAYIGNVDKDEHYDLTGKVLRFFPPMAGQSAGRLVIQVYDPDMEGRSFTDPADDYDDEDDSEPDPGKNPHMVGRDR